MPLEPYYIDAIWLTIAFLFGLMAKKIGLPPLVGFLIAGFVINFSGFVDGQLNSAVQAMSDIGVMLLLFTIGLKLKLKNLFKKEIWQTATIHIITSVFIFSLMIFCLSYFGFSIFSDLSIQSILMISFAFSFSSTVFVVKTLESRGELNSFHGKIAIGILIIQDIFAVIFIALADQKIPSLWILTLPIVLFFLRFILTKILNHLEHGEMVAVFGFFATFIAGSLSFQLLGLKSDLGALVMGMMLVNHPRSSELYDRMAEYKDFFLIAFFINIGLIGLPTFNLFMIALLMVPLMLLKGVMFLGILSKFPIRPRTVFLSSLSLSNFSEFGLIVGLVAFKNDFISEDWLIVLALMMSLSFIIAAPLDATSHRIFNRFKDRILKLNNSDQCVDSEPVDFGEASMVVVGLGSIGKTAFNFLYKNYPKKVIGLDYNHDLVAAFKTQNLPVQWADTTDALLWENLKSNSIESVFLTMSDFSSNLNTLKELKKFGNNQFKIYAICQFEDEANKLIDSGIDGVFEYKKYVGRDFVEFFLEKKVTQ